MELTESVQERAFRLEVRAFVAEHLPDDIRRKVLGFQRVDRDDYVRWQRILTARGWGAPGWAQEFGGCGWSPALRNIFEDECYSGGAPRQLPFGLSMIGPVLQRFGTQAQKDQFLPRIISLDDWWCQGYSEPGAGSDLASLKTRAEHQGSGADERYVIIGQKIWTTLAQYANWIFVLVRSNAEVKAQAGISMLLVPMNSPGITLRPIKTLDGGVDVNEVFFDNVEVPVSHLVGEENGGWAIAKYLLTHERTGIAGLGMCKRLMRRLKELARSQTRRGKPLIEDARFRDRLAKLDIDLMAHEWALLRLISLEACGQGLGITPSVLKVRGSELQGDLAALIMEAAGPYALPYVEEAMTPGLAVSTPAAAELNPLTGLYLDMRKVAIFGGTNEIQRSLIGKEIVGV